MTKPAEISLAGDHAAETCSNAIDVQARARLRAEGERGCQMSAWNGWRDAVSGWLRQFARELRHNWRLLAGAAAAIAAVAVAIEISDRQGRFDLPSGYAVRMTCETDPEAALWSGGCERIAKDIARKDQPSFLALYQAFVTAHHREIPSPATRRRFAGAPCETGFDVETALKGTRYVFIPLRVHFMEACTRAEVEAIQRELDERDRALLTIERAGLSQQALLAGALANLTEPLVLFAAAGVLAALMFL